MIVLKTTSISNLKELLTRYDLYPKKRWGQNFLVDANIVDKIIETAKIDANDYVVEIGPGLGALTQALVKKAKGVLAIDIDKSLEQPLQEALQGCNNFRVIWADVLKINVEKELCAAFGLAEIPKYKVCANIPYNITTPIIFHLLENNSNMVQATLMMQKEVATRILATPNNKDYGLLTLTLTYHAQASLGLSVSKNCFYPKPEVDSSVINIIPHDQPPISIDDEVAFKAFLKNAFQKRRKTILNICSDFFTVDKAWAGKLLDKADINPLHRPENLSLCDYARLVNVFNEKIEGF